MFKISCIQVVPETWVLWKRLNTEMPQNKAETPQKQFFLRVSAISARKTEIPQLNKGLKIF